MITFILVTLTWIKYCLSTFCTVDVIPRTTDIEVKHRPLRIVLGWGTKMVD